MLHASFWRRLAMLVACVLLLTMSLLLTMHPKAAFADQEAISINPTEGPPNTVVIVKGTGWQPGWTVPIGTDLSPTPLVTATADNNGTFTVSITIPSSAPEGQLRIWAVIGNGGSADAWFTVKQTTNVIHEVTCSDHMSAPWVAFYWDANYGTPDLCFEGVGTINLYDYGWAHQISSINIAASGFVYDDNRNSFQLYYGLELSNLFNVNGSNWNDRIVGFIVSG